jgi:hypothetical protein
MRIDRPSYVESVYAVVAVAVDAAVVVDAVVEVGSIL